MDLNSKEWFLLLMGFLFFVTVFSWIIYARFIMSRIEKAIQKDGFPRPCGWDGTGARTLWFAYAISLPIGNINRVDDPSINVPLVRRYSTIGDKILGWILIVSCSSFGLLCIVGWLIWAN